MFTKRASLIAQSTLFRSFYLLLQLDVQNNLV